MLENSTYGLNAIKTAASNSTSVIKQIKYVIVPSDTSSYKDLNDLRYTIEANINPNKTFVFIQPNASYLYEFQYISEGARYNDGGAHITGHVVSTSSTAIVIIPDYSYDPSSSNIRYRRESTYVWIIEFV